MDANVLEITAPNGSSARIAAGRGFNCFSFCPHFADGPQEMLWTDSAFLTGEARPAGSGIPILFPFPGRIRGAKFTYNGKSYELPAADGRGNAIHGFVLDRPWEVIAHADNRVTGWFQASVHAPDVLELWPTDFALEVTYEISNRDLGCWIRVENPSAEPLPYGLGTHPYLRVPLSAVGTADQCRVVVPAKNYWELQDLIPTGQKLPVDEPRNLNNPRPFPELQLDDVLTDLVPQKSRVYFAILDDTLAQRRLNLFFPESHFRECVVYNPPHREAVCIEPYTCVPGVIGDVLSGELDAATYGVEFLPPGATRTYEVHLHVQEKQA